MAAVAKAQELDSDIFGFGAELNRTNPEKWAELRERWDEEFPRVDVQVEVKAKLRRSGLLIRSTQIGYKFRPEFLDITNKYYGVGPCPGSCLPRA